jgi:hypothetical protein
MMCVLEKNNEQRPLQFASGGIYKPDRETCKIINPQSVVLLIKPLFKNIPFSHAIG